MEDEEQFEADRSDPEFIFKQLSLDVRGNYWCWIELIFRPLFYDNRKFYLIIKIANIHPI
jgi:hypothetical protein